MPRLLNKTALITGGTSGIGLATARRFLEEGARVAVTGTNPDHLAEAQKTLGRDVLALPGDAGDVAAQQSIARAIGEAFGKLDALFVNAGIAQIRPLEQWDEAQFDRTIGINLKGPFFLIQALLPIFANPASIVLNSSIGAHIGMPGTTVYGASKAGLISLAKTLSGELIGRGIRTNVISPGPIATSIFDSMGLSAAERDATKAGLASQIPLGRMGEPQEIADAVVYFASDESRFIVGSELIIDGGMTNL